MTARPIQITIPSFLILAVILQSVATSITVVGPQALVNSLVSQFGSSSIDYTLANFGAIPYGRNTTGTLVIANPMTNCDYQDDLSQTIHSMSCNSFLLLYRGECSFVRKVRNAQQEGAKLAIIMDDTIEDSEHVVMSDDGHGRQVKIPSVFIAERAGQALIDWRQSYPNDTIQIRFVLETKLTDIADLNLWLDAHTKMSYDFVASLDPFYHKLQDKTNLKVYHNIISCYTCAPEDCYSGSKYCAQRIEGNNSTGRNIIEEQLRQTFLLQENNKEWWSYMTTYGEKCFNSKDIQACSKQIMVEKGYNWEEINNKVKNSFDANGNNAILDATIALKQKTGVFFFPDVVVNNVTFHGELDGIDIFQLVCNSLKKAPRECLEFIDDESRVEGAKVESHVTRVVLIVCASLVFFAILFVCVYRRLVRKVLNREMTEQVNQLVTQYITLYESKEKDEQRP